MGRGHSSRGAGQLADGGSGSHLDTLGRSPSARVWRGGGQCRRSTSQRIASTLLVAALAMLAQPSAARAVDFTWAGPVSGSWGNANLWSPSTGVPSLAADSATIDAVGGPYTVSLDQTRTIDALFMDSWNAKVDLSENDLVAGFVIVNRGTLKIPSGSFLDVSNEQELSFNHGIIELGTSGAVMPAKMQLNVFFNYGNINVMGPTRLSGDGLFHNELFDSGNLHVAPAGILTVASEGAGEPVRWQTNGSFTVEGHARFEGATYSQQRLSTPGNLTISGLFEVVNGRFEVLGGSVTGTVRLIDSTLSLSAAGSPAATFELSGESYLEGVAPGNQINATGYVRWVGYSDMNGDLTLRPDELGRAGLHPYSASATSGNPLTNRGAIVLEGTEAHPQVPLNLKAKLVNYGTLEVAPGTVTDYTGPRLEVLGGTVDSQGLLRMDHATLANFGGTVSGNFELNEGVLNLQQPGSAQVTLRGDSTIYSLAAGHQARLATEPGETVTVTIKDEVFTSDPTFYSYNGTLRADLAAESTADLTIDLKYTYPLSAVPNLIISGPAEGMGRLRIDDLAVPVLFVARSVEALGHSELEVENLLIDVGSQWTIHPGAELDLVVSGAPETAGLLGDRTVIVSPGTAIDNQGTLRVHGNFSSFGGTLTGGPIDVVNGILEIANELTSEPPLVYSETGNFRVHDGSMEGDLTTEIQVEFVGAENLWSRTTNTTIGYLYPDANLVNQGAVTVSEGVLRAVPSAGRMTKNEGLLHLVEGTSLEATGDVVQTAAGRLELELSSALPGAHLAATGNVSLAGALEIELGEDPSSLPLSGQTFEIVSAGGILGAFETLSGLFYNDPDSGLNLVLWPEYSADHLTLTVRLVGDAGGDGAVGAADYAAWAAQFGQTGRYLSADWNLDGTVGAADYAIWAANFGQHLGAVPVPEPSGLALLALGGAVAAGGARRRSGNLRLPGSR